MESEKIKHRCCFTGHRPDKMTQTEEEIRILLEKAIDDAIKDGYITFITGMAMGVDVWAAEIVLDRMNRNSDIHLICALPHPNFEKRRTEYEIKRFNSIINSASLEKVINDHYFRGCYQVRNEWMVDHSSRVIAVFNGEKGGTLNTINYAKRKNVKIINVLEGFDN